MNFDSENSVNWKSKKFDGEVKVKVRRDLEKSVVNGEE